MYFGQIFFYGGQLSSEIAPGDQALGDLIPDQVHSPVLDETQQVLGLLIAQSRFQDLVDLNGLSHSSSHVLSSDGSPPG